MLLLFRYLNFMYFYRFHQIVKMFVTLELVNETNEEDSATKSMKNGGLW